MPAEARSALPHAEARPAPIGTTPRPQAAVGQPAHAGFHWRIWGAEFAGTGLLILGGLSVVCFVFGRGSPVTSILPSHSARLLVTGLLFSACNSLLAVSPLGRLSGAHLNPAVTLAFRVLGRVSAQDVSGYIVAQVLGAVAVGLAWRRRHPGAQPKTAKLFHDARYPCSLASELPTSGPSVDTRPTAAYRL